MAEAEPVASDTAAGADSAPPARPRAAPAILGWALVAGLAGGIAAWLAGEATFRFFRPALEEVEIMGSKQRVVTVKTGHEAEARNGALAASLLAACLGLTLGAAGGFLHRSPAAALYSAVIGLVAAGSATALVGLTVYRALLEHRDPISGDLVLPLLTHAAVWVAAGAAAGLAFGIGLGARSYALRCALGGLVGAALAAVVFETLGAFAFPHAKTDDPVSITWVTRLLARTLVALFVAAGAGMSAAAPVRGRVKTSTIVDSENPVAQGPVKPLPA